MSQRTYDTITLACLLMAVASAVAFQHAEAYQMEAGTVGVLSAVLAAATYYVYHVRSEKRSDGKPVAEPKDNPEGSSQISSHPQIRKMFTTLSESTDTASVLRQAVLEALSRDLIAGSKSVWKSPVSKYRMEQEIQDIERELAWIRSHLLSSREAGRDSRRVSRTAMVRPKLNKGVVPPKAVQKVRPKPFRASVWESDTGAIEGPSSWSEARHRAVA